MVTSYEKNSLTNKVVAPLNIDTSKQTNYKLEITLGEIHDKNAQLFRNLDKISKYHMKIFRIYYYFSMIILLQRFLFTHSIWFFFGFVVMNLGIYFYSNVFSVTLFTFIFTIFDILLIVYDMIFFNSESSFTNISIAIQIVFWIKILYEIVLWKTDEYWVYDLQTNTQLKEHMPHHLKQVITYQDTMRIAFSHIYNSGPILIFLTHLAGIEANNFIEHKDREKKLKKKWIDPYNIDMSIFEKHWSEHVTMNEWFGRRLKLKNSNGPYIPTNYVFRNLPRIIENFAVSPGDCRMMVFPELNDVSKWWIKGEKFDIEALVDIDNFPHVFGNLQPTDFCMMISRLAVQDYHCFHSPIEGKILKHHKVRNGSYFGVNPLLIQHRNEVLKTNVREILVMQGNGVSQNFGRVIYIIVGAAMVGSIEIEDKIFTEQNGQVKIGDYLGKFQFGGSTVITLYEKNRIKFHETFISASRQSVETKVCLLDSIGKAIIGRVITPSLLKLFKD